MSTYDWSETRINPSFSPSPQSSKSTPSHSSSITHSSSSAPLPPLPTLNKATKKTNHHQPTVGERRQSKNNKPMLVVYPQKQQKGTLNSNYLNQPHYYHGTSHHQSMNNNHNNKSIEGLLLASPPPTATKLPTREMLKMPRLHQTFYFHPKAKYNHHPHLKKSSSSSSLPPHTVGFAEYGDLEKGYPTFVIGGHGCTRLVGIMFEELAQQHGLRMIWPERPGYGLSDEMNPQKLNVLDWAQVLIQLADHLNIQKFSIIAQSVGTVFAMAVAHLYPDRIMGPMYLVSPWVSTQQAGTFKWTRRLPARLVTRSLSFAMDIMWLFNNNNTNNSQFQLLINNSKSTPSSSSSSSTTSTSSNNNNNGMATPPQSPIQHLNDNNNNHHPKIDTINDHLDEEEDNEFLAALEKEKDNDIQTDIPPHRPLRHMVRPRHITLYVAMNKLRMQEPYHQGQLCDVLIALEKYHSFGFSYNQVRCSVSAVWGEKDQLIPQKAIDLLANQVSDLRLKILDGEAHDLIWKEGVMAWAIRGIGERWRSRQQQQQQ
ncbi:unnamed protein product [Cunninghamella blakesleeana]